MVVLGQTVTFSRRRYGGRHGMTYTWAHIGDDTLGDPWPAINWPRKELEKVVQRYLNAKAGLPPIAFVPEETIIRLLTK